MKVILFQFIFPPIALDYKRFWLKLYAKESQGKGQEHLTLTNKEFLTPTPPFFFTFSIPGLTILYHYKKAFFFFFWGGRR